MGILDIIILLFFIISIIWTFIKERNDKAEPSDASGTREKGKKGEKRQNPKPVPSTISEDSEENIDYIKLSGDDHKRCNHCEKVIGIKDSFCSYCGLPNLEMNA
ncbi:hypothetical protein [Ureibacillus sinduriensis]|uniref:Zinc ribbon domain-containing protein n=2 Tax=Ureibacillus sinduriensis TaxID=561440 RepID=A0A0A3HYE1_9BACL|nr:hypothetical protein [Ureibacillus sinduriensis]KGR76250.1 hypothetical protein CD33_06800 [Ureibacillus sinduriensis BLB-1 = JCM 15800]